MAYNTIREEQFLCIVLNTTVYIKKTSIVSDTTVGKKFL